ESAPASGGAALVLSASSRVSTVSTRVALASPVEPPPPPAELDELVEPAAPVGGEEVELQAATAAIVPMSPSGRSREVTRRRPRFVLLKVAFIFMGRVTSVPGSRQARTARGLRPHEWPRKSTETGFARPRLP